MNIVISINADNEAFENEAELNRILNTVTGVDGQKLRDVNGNTVGTVKII